MGALTGYPQNARALVGACRRHLGAPVRSGEADEPGGGAHDHAAPVDDEAEIDDIQPPQHDVGALAPEEAHIVEHGRQRRDEQAGDRDGADHLDDAPPAFAHQVVDRVECHLLTVLDDQRLGQEHQPEEDHHDQLVGPGERSRQHVARKDADEE
jgi:hypothetical protein